MNKFINTIISFFSTIILIFLSVSPASAAISADKKLYFNSDGKFKIVVFADCQDGASPNSKMISFMEACLDYEKPDFVVFTGDNVMVAINSSFKNGATKLLNPLIKRNIPYAYTYGNHDDQFGVSKEYQYGIYSTLGTCLTFDEKPELTGFGNCAIPIYNPDNGKIDFNLWMIDSNSYDGSKYDHVHQDQLDWFVQRSHELNQAAGKKVNSIVFQHIILPEAYQLLVEDSGGSKTYAGKTYRQELNEKASGYLGEFPCPPAENGGQFDVMNNEGNVLGIVTGHDHSNSFVGTVGNIDFIQTGGMSFRSYGDENARSYRVIELDQNNLDTYKTRAVKYLDYENGALNGSPSLDAGLTEYSYKPGTTFISEITFAGSMDADTAKNSLINNGYTPIYYDLNFGTNGQTIYLGYKTTSNYEDAIKSIRFYSAGSNSDALEYLSVVNGNHVYYTRVNSQDLNNKARGDYIYGFYTKDPLAGPAITSLSVYSTPNNDGYTVSTSFSKPTAPANLNEGTSGNAMYLHSRSASISVLDTFELRFEFAQCQKLANTYGIEEKFGSAYNRAQDIFFELSNCGATTASQSEIEEMTTQLLLSRLNLNFDIRYYSDGELLLNEHKLFEQGYSVSDFIPQKDGSLFVGWTPDDNSASAEYFAGDVYSAEADLNLNAVWKPFSELIYPKAGSDAEIDYSERLVYGLTPGLNQLNEYIDTADGYKYTLKKSGTVVATDSKVNLIDGANKTLDTYAVVIFGDVNSDGVYDGEDAVVVNLLASGMLSKDKISAAAYTAADCNHDGTVNGLDADLLNEAGVLLTSVGQK